MGGGGGAGVGGAGGWGEREEGREGGRERGGPEDGTGRGQRPTELRIWRELIWFVLWFEMQET